MIYRPSYLVDHPKDGAAQWIPDADFLLVLSNRKERERLTSVLCV